MVWCTSVRCRYPMGFCSVFGEGIIFTADSKWVSDKSRRSYTKKCHAFIFLVHLPCWIIEKLLKTAINNLQLPVFLGYRAPLVSGTLLPYFLIPLALAQYSLGTEHSWFIPCWYWFQSVCSVLIPVPICTNLTYLIPEPYTWQNTVHHNLPYCCNLA